MAKPKMLFISWISHSRRSQLIADQFQMKLYLVHSLKRRPYLAPLRYILQAIKTGPLNATTVALVISRLTGITFSFTAHANDIFANPILLPEKIKAARFIIAISDYNIRFLHTLAPGPANLEKMHLVHCGIDVQNFSAPQDRPENDRPLIVGVGRLVEKKGYPYLVKACRILAEQGYDFECLIIGGGPQEALLKQMVEENGLSRQVKLMGVVFQEHLRDYLNRADLFVLPCVVGKDQDMDGIPNTLMEAMAMQIPVISTTVSGIPELIEDGKTGLLAPPEDETALAKAMARLLDDKALRDRLGKAGRAKVMAEFEIEKNANALLNIFQIYLGDETTPLKSTEKQTHPVVANLTR